MLSNDAIAAILDPDNQKGWIVAIPKGDGVFSMHYNGPDFRERTEAWRLEDYITDTGCYYTRGPKSISDLSWTSVFNQFDDEIVCMADHNAALITALPDAAEFAKETE
jgi:hypothetical protein